jgi:hypothetical protein
MLSFDLGIGWLMSVSWGLRVFVRKEAYDRGVRIYFYSETVRDRDASKTRHPYYRR